MSGLQPWPAFLFGMPAIGPLPAGYARFEPDVRVGQRRLDLGFAAADRPARLDEVVPLGRFLAGQISSAVAQAAGEEGKQISCRKKCSACCRYLVAISAAEAFRMAREIDSLPESRRGGLRGKFQAAASKILSAGRPPVGDMNELSAWYWQLGLECPCLSEEGLCQVYDLRPAVCRQHLVCTPQTQCSGPRPGGEALAQPVQLAEVLAELSERLSPSGGQSVLLPLAMEFAKAEQARTEHTWPAQQMGEYLVDIIRRHIRGTHLAQRPSRRAA